MASFNYQEAKQCRTIKPALLKDYLLDDISSCSSNGFKSFPRRQCCTTVRFLVDNDLKSKSKTSISVKRQSFNKTRQPPPTTSVFQKASEVVLNAVKLLSIHNRSNLSLKSGFLARNFSRKVFKRTFWKKKNVDGQIQDGEIHRWKTFHNLIADFPETPPYCIPSTISNTSNSTSATPAFTITITPPTTTNTTTATTNSTATTDSKDSSKSSSWSENEFTSEVRSGGSSLTDKVKDWVVGKDEKEQFSPVSVLESPFRGGDRDDTNTSPTNSDSNLVQNKGTVIKKRQCRFKTLEEMEPINLDNRLATLSEFCNIETVDDISNLNDEKAQKILEHVKSRIGTKVTFCADNLLLDFFMESFDESESNRGGLTVVEEGLRYLSGEVKEMGFDWRDVESRKWYIKDMEKGGRWKHFDDERIDFVKEIEGMIWECLMNELMSEMEE